MAALGRWGGHEGKIWTNWTLSSPGSYIGRHIFPSQHSTYIIRHKQVCGSQDRYLEAELLVCNARQWQPPQTAELTGHLSAGPGFWYQEAGVPKKPGECGKRQMRGKWHTQSKEKFGNQGHLRWEQHTKMPPLILRISVYSYVV